MPSESFAIATPAGFVGIDFAAEIACAREHRFLDRNGYDSSSAGTPRALTLIYPAGQGDGHQRGLNHLGHQGLLRRDRRSLGPGEAATARGCESQPRYTTSDFLWMKLGNALRSRNAAPRIYGRADEARMHLLARRELACVK